MAEFVASGRTVPAENGWKWIVEGWTLSMRLPAIWLTQMAILYVIFIIPVAGAFASIVLGPVLVAGLMIGSRSVQETGTLKINQLFSGFHERFGTLLSLGLLYLAAVILISLVAGAIMGVELLQILASGQIDLAVLASFAITLLLGLLVMLALLMPVAMALWFAPALVVFHGLGVTAALKSSFVVCLKNFTPFLIYGLVLFIPSLVASIVLWRLAWIPLGALVAASIYTSYKDIYFS